MPATSYTPRATPVTPRTASAVTRAAAATRAAPDQVSDVVRWAAFSTALVPVVLLMCGSSPAGAFATTAGLAAVTAACHALLRRSARGEVRPAAEQALPHRGRHGRTGSGAHRGGRRPSQL
ncbi:hypothetical protein [Streptomyces axinellae]|uniref:Uncharacterized protein n=1 Tax=Streptomyces axinellae TaxID=552788 RepID=A0ABN3Q3W2_9ACTN